MKKPLLFLLAACTPLMNANCLLEPDREYVTDTLTVLVHDTTRIHDTTYSYRDTLRLHDTLRITKTVHDTLVKHDTLRTIVTKVDTFWKHDTLRTFATNTQSSALTGTWENIIGGQTVRLTISTEVYPYTSYSFSFTANVGMKAYNGYIKGVSGNTATVDINGPSAYGEDANWIFSVSNNVLSLQQSGFQMFPTSQLFTLNRLN